MKTSRSLYRVWRPYNEWEDWQNGMYDPPTFDAETMIAFAQHLLSSQRLFLQSALAVVHQWPISSMVNLTNVSCNRRAWVGQAACCFSCHVPELLTREAWKQLPESTKVEANATADVVIKRFENTYRELRQHMGAQMLFQWDPG